MVDLNTPLVVIVNFPSFTVLSVKRINVELEIWVIKETKN